MNIHTISKLMFIGIWLLLGMLSPVLAHAGCVQSDMGGTWHTYGLIIATAPSGDAASTSCKIKINSSGSIVASKSSCKDRSSFGTQYSYDVLGGKITVNSKCNLSGKVRSDDSVFLDKMILDHGMLAQDLKTFSLVAHYEGRPDIVIHLNGVKR